MGSSEKIYVAGMPITVERKHIKNIYLRVKAPDGRVVVSAPLWVSHETVESVIEDKLCWIQKKQESMQDSPCRNFKALSSEERVEKSKELASLAEPLVKYWSGIMQVSPGALAYRDMTSRWGSCNVKTGRICLNLRLLEHPIECLEYLVVHELCHLLERGHGPKFKALMDQYLPDWRKRRKLLREA